MVAKKRKRREPFGKLRTLPSGRHQASYVGPDGNRHTAPQTFDNLTDARAWLALQRASMVRGDWGQVSDRSGSDLSLGEFAQQWLRTRTGRDGVQLRLRTRTEYERLLGGSLARLAAHPLDKITPSIVRAWYAEMLETGRKTQAARAYGLLRSIMGTAHQDGLISENPCKIRGAQNASTGRKADLPTATELGTIVESITPRYRAAIILAAWGALRYGELTELRRRDLVEDADGNLIVNVTRAVTQTTGVGFTIGAPKSDAGVRSVVIPPHVAGIVRAHLTEYVDPGPDALLFPASGGGHLGQSSFTKHYYPARAAAGRADMPFHTLRHFGLTRYAQAGATLRELQERAGHSTVTAAMKYQHAAGRDADLARRMSEGG